MAIKLRLIQTMWDSENDLTIFIVPACHGVQLK